MEGIQGHCGGENRVANYNPLIAGADELARREAQRLGLSLVRVSNGDYVSFGTDRKRRYPTTTGSFIVVLADGTTHLEVNNG